MQNYYRIEKRLEYINSNLNKLQNSALALYTIEGNVLRGLDISGRILYVREFIDERELFQFISGMEHIMEVV